MTSYHVKIRNLGLAARVIHDDQIPIRIGAGETAEAVLLEDTIKRLKAEHTAEDEPRLEIEQGAKAEEPEAPPSEENHASQHKPRPAHK